MRSKNCRPFKDATPIYRNTPKRTGIGICPNIGVKNTDKPIDRNISIWVTLCSLTPKNFGLSPGAALSDSNFKELTWFMDKTVAATNQGIPIMEHSNISKERTNRSRWYPQPVKKMTAQLLDSHLFYFSSGRIYKNNRGAGGKIDLCGHVLDDSKNNKVDFHLPTIVEYMSYLFPLYDYDYLLFVIRKT